MANLFSSHIELPAPVAEWKQVVLETARNVAASGGYVLVQWYESYQRPGTVSYDGPFCKEMLYEGDDLVRGYPGTRAHHSFRSSFYAGSSWSPSYWVHNSYDVESYEETHLRLAAEEKTRHEATGLMYVQVVYGVDYDSRIEVEGGKLPGYFGNYWLEGAGFQKNQHWTPGTREEISFEELLSRFDRLEEVISRDHSRGTMREHGLSQIEPARVFLKENFSRFATE